MTPAKLKVAAAGLGRMGKRHATNFLNRAPRAVLVAAFSPDPDELAWAKVNLEPYGVILYDDYDTMIQQPGLQAVVIGTATSVHAEEAIKAMEKNLHVLCEKPLSTNIKIVSSAQFSALHPLEIPRADPFVLFSANRSSMQHESDLILKSCAGSRDVSTIHTATRTRRPRKV